MLANERFCFARSLDLQFGLFAIRVRPRTQHTLDFVFSAGQQKKVNYALDPLFLYVCVCTSSYTRTVVDTFIV